MLGNNPHRSQIYNEFGTNTRLSVSYRSLSSMYNLIFGTSTNFRRNDFSGLGQPEGTSLQPSDKGVTYITARVNISFIGSSNGAYYYFQWWEGHGSAPSNPNLTSPELAFSSNDYTTPIVDLDADTEYSYRAVLYNSFNNNTSDHKILGVIQTTTDEEPAQPPATPVLNSIAYQQEVVSGVHQYKLWWSNGSNPDDYFIQYHADVAGPPTGASGTDGGNITNIINDSEGVTTFQTGASLPPNGYWLRMRAYKNNLYSDWSNWVLED